MLFDSNVIKPSASAPRWQDVIKKYQTPETWRGIWQISNTITPYIVLWYLMYLSLSYSYFLTLLLALPAAGLVMRTFIIQHDCGHGSFFKSQKANDLVGTFCGFLTMVPYYQWRHEHAIHHATSGDLDRRGVGDVSTLTVKEYLAMSKWKRFQYRFYRNMAVMLVIGPIWTFVVSHRFVRKNSGRREARNVYLTDLALLAIWSSLCLTIGVKGFLMIWIPVTMFSGVMGIWLFYVQHQYENSYWRRKEEWDYVTSAVMGSSYFKLPRALQWFSGNIGFHHIHHLSPKIPNYKLEQCHNETPMFQEAVVLDLRSSLKSGSLKLWDEEQRKMVGFKHLKSSNS
ncbi:MAG: fatty acid desaturase [Blastocatellales bacterium]